MSHDDRLLTALYVLANGKPDVQVGLERAQRLVGLLDESTLLACAQGIHLQKRVDEFLAECTRQRELCRSLIARARATGYVGLADDLEKELATGDQK